MLCNLTTTYCPPPTVNNAANDTSIITQMYKKCGRENETRLKCSKCKKIKSSKNVKTRSLCT